MNFKLEFNNDIHVLPIKPSSLADLRRMIKELYEELKKGDIYQIQYKDRDGFMMTIASESDFTQAIQNAVEIKQASFKFYLVLDVQAQQFTLITQEKSNLGIKTPSTISDPVPGSRPKFFLFDNSNTTSSDEKFMGPEPASDRERVLFKSSGENALPDSRSTFKMEEPLGFIRVEEEKALDSKPELKKAEKESKKSKKTEFINSQNAFSRVEKFHSVKCYKCKGTGRNLTKSGQKCKKCKGVGDYSGSIKSSVIDYFIKERLKYIYKEFEQKSSQSDLSRQKYFASENMNTTTTLFTSNSSFGVCTVCGVNIEGPFKFRCSKCPLLTLCDKCEEAIDHPHPLMKIKRNAAEEAKNNFSKSVQLSYPFSSTDSNQQGKPIKKSLISPKEPTTETQSRLTQSTSSSFKAKFLNEPATEKVPLNSQFTLYFMIQNSGDSKWPENMEFICISGYFQSTSVAVPSLEAGDKYTVNVSLVAPNKEETLNSSWRLGYLNKNDKKFFGPKISTTVLTLKSEKLAARENLKDTKDIKKKFISH